MKFLIIGANGRQGRLLTARAEGRGHEVIALSPDGMGDIPFHGKILTKSLFDLEEQDLEGVDAVLSAFGSGFAADPTINRQAVDYLISLLYPYSHSFVGQQGIRLLILGGAGTLWSDKTHTCRVWQTPEHPEFLKEISKNLTLALEDLRTSGLRDWTFLCPSLFFDYEGKETGTWKIGTEGLPLKNHEGVSRISYRDFAVAMIEEAETGAHQRMQITVCEV